MSKFREIRRWRSILTVVLAGLLTFGGVLFVAGLLRTERPPHMKPVVVASGEWAPFVGPDLPEGGPIAEVMQEVLATAGFNPQVTFLSWAEVERRIDQGSVFGGFPLVLSKDRQSRMLYSVPIFSAEYVIFVRAGAANSPKTAEDLSQLKVGGITGYDYWAELDDVVVDMNRYDDIVDGFAALLAGEIDVFVEASAPAQHVLNDPEIPFDRTSFAVVESKEAWARSMEDLVFMVPKTKEGEKSIARINRALADFKMTRDYRLMVATFEADVPAADRVVLTSTEGELVRVFDGDSVLLAKLPAGAKARVIEWPKALTNPKKQGQAVPRVKVKFESGPMAGRIAWVFANELEMLS